MIFVWLSLLFVLLHGWGLLRVSRNCSPPWARNTSRALLVVAHPDDEALFFANYINSATRAGVRVHVLCLSTGNADGLGKVREKELLRSCALFQITRDRVTVLDEPRLQDGFHEWDAVAVASAVTKALEAVRPDELVTFDARGVSGHPNHTSIFRAVRQVPCYGGCVHLNVRIPWEWMVGNCVPVMAITLPSACAALLHRINNTTTTPNRGMLDGSAAPQAAAGDGDGSGAKPCHVYTLVGSLVARVGRSSVSAHGGSCGRGSRRGAPGLLSGTVSEEKELAAADLAAMLEAEEVKPWQRQ
eukprot:XP_001691438.1 N-acetylglucosaminyl-phosphatidylinositol de-N-acetylase [Chlamydomonas reinhardtii]